MMGLAEARRKHPSDQTLFGQQMVSRADRTRRNPLSKEPPDKTGSLFDERRSLPIEFLPEKLGRIAKKRFPMPWSKPESRSPPPLSRRCLGCKTDRSQRIQRRPFIASRHSAANAWALEASRTMSMEQVMYRIPISAYSTTWSAVGA